MLFFRRRDTSINQSNLTDQERCIHACLFFAFILLVITIVLFYFAATTKDQTDQRLYYYIGAGICLALLVLIIILTMVYVRRAYGSSLPSNRQHNFQAAADYDRAVYPNYQA